MKKTILAVLTLFWCLAAFAKTHTVVRGESLQSIAQSYNITVEQLTAANPGAEKLFYVGLKLNIPEQTANAPTTGQPQSAQPTGQTDTNLPASENVAEEAPAVEGESKTFVMLDASYGFLKKMKGVSGTNNTLSFTVGAGYKFYKNLYGGVGIGYNSADYNMMAQYGPGNYAKTKTSYHFITIPLEMGYIIGNKVGLIPHIGFDLNICVSAKSKYTDSDTQLSGKPKKPFGADFKAGVKLNLWGFNITGAYHIPLNKGQKQAFGKKAYFSIGIGYGF